MSKDINSLVEQKDCIKQKKQLMFQIWKRFLKISRMKRILEKNYRG